MWLLPFNFYSGWSGWYRTGDPEGRDVFRQFLAHKKRSKRKRSGRC